MRIGIIAPPWLPVPPSAYGGTELVVDRLARGLQNLGQDVVLVAHAASTCPVLTLSVLPHEEELPIGTAVPELAHVLAAYDLLRSCDVVHDHTITGPLLAVRHPDTTVVTTAHGPFDPEMTRVFRALPSNVSLIAISRAQARSAVDVPIARVIHHGIDVEHFPFGRGDGGYFAFLGRMDPSKGVHRACELAHRAGVPLRVAAKMRERPEREYFEQCVRPLLGGDVEYLGELGGQDKHDLLAGAAALLNPIAWAEPFGMAMIEALACGTPVITSPLGAAPEIVEHGVSGFWCNDDQEFIDALAAAADLDRRASRERVARHFSTKRMAAAHLDLYRSLTGHVASTELTAVG